MKKRTRFILQWIWIIPLLIWFVLTAYAGLSNETEELVNDLRWKHSGFITTETQNIIEYDSNIVYEWWSMTFDDETGILYVETQDGKWFVEMKAVEGNNNGNDD